MPYQTPTLPGRGLSGAGDGDSDLVTLAAVTGAGLIGYQRAETGAAATSIHDKLGAILDAKLDFGATGDGVTDDTAALQAAVDAAESSGRRLYIPKGTYSLTSTLNISTGGAAGSEKYVSIYGDGPTLTKLRWDGATTGNAVNVTYNKFFHLKQFGVYNGVAKGTTIGVLLGGPLTTGTQTLAGIFEHILIDSFNIGMLAGAYTGHAASEILYVHCYFQSNDTGWKNADLNTLDHQFIMLLIGANGTGLDVNSGNCSVQGGSASGSSVADFALSNAGTPFSVRDFRSETANRFLVKGTSSTYHTVAVANCLVQAITNVDNIAIIAGGNCLLSVRDSSILAKIRMGANGVATHLVMENNVVVGDTALPFFTVTDSYDNALNLRYDTRANLNYDTGAWYDDEIGQFVSLTRMPLLTVKRAPTAAPSYLNLNRVKMLAAGSTADGRNLRLQEKFASAGTLAVTFTRAVTVGTTNGTTSVTFTAGTINVADVGKKIVLVAADGAGGNVTGIIQSLDSGTALTILATVNAGIGVTSGAITANIGEDEPDANYLLMLASDAQEKISWSAKATTGFTLTSDNATSTATVDILVVR